MTSDRFTEGRLTQRLGEPPARLPDGGYDLAGANLSRMSLTKAQLAGSRLRGADLRGSDLLRAELRGCDLREADLSEAKLPQADLRQADLRGANLTRAVLHGAVVDGCQLTGAVLSGSSWRAVALWRTDLLPSRWPPDAEVVFGDVLRATGPHSSELAEALRWLTSLGSHEDLPILEALIADRRWRPARDVLVHALSALNLRIGPLSDASLSRAEPASPLTDRSLSRWRKD